MTERIEYKTDTLSETVDLDLLYSYGGMCKSYNKDEYIFIEGHEPQYYHQVVAGKIKMVSEGNPEKDFIQGFFSAGNSFGEPAVFDGGEYLASAVAEQPSVILRLRIPSFFLMLKENFEVHFNITKLLAKRIKGKANALKAITCYSPEQRIISLLNNFKIEKNRDHNTGKVKIDYTRRQIAEMKGLRVETVIRVMRSMYNKNILTIEKGKVFY